MIIEIDSLFTLFMTKILAKLVLTSGRSCAIVYLSYKRSARKYGQHREKN